MKDKLRAYCKLGVIAIVLFLFVCLATVVILTSFEEGISYSISVYVVGGIILAGIVSQLVIFGLYMIKENWLKIND